MLLFPSPQWVTAWIELANADEAFRSAGAGWDGVVVVGTVFTIRAPYKAWKSVIRQELHPVAGIVQGRLRLRGQMSTFVRWAHALVIMTKLAERLDTTFVDEQQ